MIARTTAICAFALHAATAWRYGYFRDELYFIACAKHLAWGYVDQPPLVAVAAWLAAPLGYALEPLRLLPMIASSLAAAVAVLIARDLGGGRFAQWTAGIGVALLPAYLILGNTLTTTSFESLTWGVIVWCCIRIVRGGGRGWWLALAVAYAVALYGKYSVVLLLGALAAGLLLTPERRVLRTASLPLAAAVTIALVLPNVLWQGAHEWPMLEVLHGDAAHRHAFATGASLEYRDLGKNFVIFTLLQFVYTNCVAAIIWIVGLAAPFRRASLRDMRWLSAGYVVLFAATALLDGKGYYAIGVYGPLLALGGVAVEHYASPVRAGIAACALAVALFMLPFSLPVLPLSRFIAYTQFIGFTGRSGAPAHLMQPLFAEEFGWDRLAADVSKVYDRLPPRQRAATAIYADTYADAGAVDFFSSRYGLPGAISSQNTYWLWGTRGYSGSTIIAIGATRIDTLKAHYRSCALARVSTEPLRWVAEGPSPIWLCSGPDRPLLQLWPLLRWYGA